MKCGSSVPHAQFGFITRAGWTPVSKTMMEPTPVLIELLKNFNASLTVQHCKTGFSCPSGSFAHCSLDGCCSLVSNMITC